MNHKFWRVFLVLVLFVSGSLLCSPTKQYLTILHTNDTHSTLFPYGPLDAWGGIARISTLIKEIKAENSNVLTLNTGDVFVGTFEFNKYLGYPELKIMEELYDAMCLGNHEFDLGFEALFGILSGQMGGGDEVNLPILCANVNLSGSPLQSFVKPCIVKEAGGLKIGLFGVVNYDALNYSPEVYDLLSDPFAAAGQAVLDLKGMGADIIICLSHLGKMYDLAGLTSVPGIDIIVGGHTHDALFQPLVINGKIIVQAGEFGHYLGYLNIEYDGIQVRLLNGGLLAVDKKVRKDPSLLATLNALRDGIVMDPRFGPVYTEHVATAPWDLEERWQLDRPERDTALGNLVADAIRGAVAGAGFPADIGLEANGYIAYKIHQGKVVGNDILKAVPYGYDLVSGLGFKLDTVLLAGAQILAGLEYSVSMVEYTDDASMQASGLTFEYDSTRTPIPPDQLLEELMKGNWGRVDPASVKINGQPLNLEGIYWVALTEQLHKFLLANGLVPFASMQTGLLEYSAVRDWMSQLTVLNYTAEGRIVDTSVQE